MNPGIINSQPEYLYARDFSNREDLWAFVKELETAGDSVVVDDNWSIIYRTPHHNKREET